MMSCAQNTLWYHSRINLKYTRSPKGMLFGMTVVENLNCTRAWVVITVFKTQSKVSVYVRKKSDTIGAQSAGWSIAMLGISLVGVLCLMFWIKWSF
jgi:hypothetical protein